MSLSDRRTTRRGALAGAAALLPAATLLVPAARARPLAPRGPSRHDGPVARGLLDLEREYDARVGVFAAQAGRGRVVRFRADRRIAFCSTAKALLVGVVLGQRSVADLERVVHYGASDLVANSPITSQHVADGLSLRGLADAAIRYSDNTAANLLIRDIGGPGAFTAGLRRLGDRVTRSDRFEPELNTAIPGDPRDTTTPRAIATSLARLTVGRSLPAEKRRILNDLLERNTTGDALIRSAVPAGWTVGDKTGTGSYGTRNDIAILRPPAAPPIVLAVLTTRPQPDAATDDTLIARAAAVALRPFGA